MAIKKEVAVMQPVPIPTIEEIEQYVIDAGSDHVPTFGGKFEGGIQIQQVPDEIAPCLHDILASGATINNYLEIWACAGGTAFLMNRFLKPEKIVLIDNNRHPKHHIRPYILSNVERIEIIGDSHSEGTAAAIDNLKIDFDLILIDGDHSYEGVKADFLIYSTFLSKDGLLMFHDSVLPGFGVKRLVDELKYNPEYQLIGEYASKKHNHPCGLALFRKVGV